MFDILNYFQYILLHYQDDPMKYDSAIGEIENMRSVFFILLTIHHIFIVGIVWIYLSGDVDVNLNNLHNLQ